MKIRRFHIFIGTFQLKKLQKQEILKNELLSTRSGILKMQPAVFMDRNDSNSQAIKKKKYVRAAVPSCWKGRRLFSFGTIVAFAWFVRHSLVVLVIAFPKPFG